MLRHLIPASCPLCGQDCEHAICAGCWRQAFGNPGRRCSQCAIPLHGADELLCGGCLQHSPAFDRTLTAVDYDPPIDRMVLALKYAGKLELASLCVTALVPVARREAALPDLICPVPLSADRLRERGYNQALEIARPLARALGLPLAASLLERIRETSPQAQLPAALRRANVCNAFVAMPRNAGSVENRHVGVVDDVMTTGATLDEVAATLKRFGASRVTNIVFARTPQH